MRFRRCYAGLIMMRVTHAIFLEVKYFSSPEAIWPDDLSETRCVFWETQSVGAALQSVSDSCTGVKSLPGPPPLPPPSLRALCNKNPALASHWSRSPGLGASWSVIGWEVWTDCVGVWESWEVRWLGGAGCKCRQMINIPGWTWVDFYIAMIRYFWIILLLIPSYNHLSPSDCTLRNTEIHYHVYGLKSLLDNYNYVTEVS